MAEARSAAPLIPLQYFANRTRVTGNVVTLFFTAAFFTYIFLLRRVRPGHPDAGLRR